jgi:hypothetical protein
MSNIYFESQRGGLCRMHSLNAFYGHPLLNEASFAKCLSEFDREYNQMGIPSCSSWDSIIANQENVIAYFLRIKSKLATIYIPPNYVEQTFKLWGVDKLSELVDPLYPKVFVFNESHIWLVLKQHNKWHSADSLSGIRPTDLEQLGRSKNLGFIIVLGTTNICLALTRIKQRIVNTIDHNISIVHSNTQYSKQKLFNYIHTELMNRKGISSYEIDLSTFFHYLHIVQPNHKSFKIFWNFFVKYQQSPANFVNIKRYVPCLLHYIYTCSISF